MPTLEERVLFLEQAMRMLLPQSGGGNVLATAAVANAASDRGVEERYVAQRGFDATRAFMGAAGAAAAPVGFTIDVRFRGGLNTAQKNAFKAAADRWTRVITGSLPAVKVNGEDVTGVVIHAQGANIDGPGNVLGQAGPSQLRPSNAGTAAFLPALGSMTFDTADLVMMQADGTLGDVITHEMGHVLGIGTIWDLKGLLSGAGSGTPTFTGTMASAAFGVLQGTNVPAPVPVENQGGPGTADSHWNDVLFRNELMTGFVNSSGGNPLSRLSVASLADLGYQVDMNAAEPYALPNIAALAAMGALGPAAGAIDMHRVLPIIPMVLPPTALV